MHRHPPVIAEHRAVQHDLLQQLDELVGQVGRHEGLDGHRDVLRVLGLREGGLHDLVDERPAVLVGLVQHLCPQFLVPPLDEVAGLALEEGVLVAHLDQLAVALAALVGHAGEVGVALLAVFTNNPAIIKLVLPTETLSITFIAIIMLY